MPDFNEFRRMEDRKYHPLRLQELRAGVDEAEAELAEVRWIYGNDGKPEKYSKHAELQLAAAQKQLAEAERAALATFSTNAPSFESVTRT